MCNHNVKLGGQLIDGLIGGFIAFCLGLNETLHKVLQIKLRLLGVRRWVVWLIRTLVAA